MKKDTPEEHSGFYKVSKFSNFQISRFVSLAIYTIRCAGSQFSARYNGRKKLQICPASSSSTWCPCCGSSRCSRWINFESFVDRIVVIKYFDVHRGVIIHENEDCCLDRYANLDLSIIEIFYFYGVIVSLKWLQKSVNDSFFRWEIFLISYQDRLEIE